MNKTDLLKQIKSELEQIDPYPWLEVEKWVQKTLPLIRNYFKDDLEDFKKVIEQPRPTTYPLAITRDRVESKRRLEEKKKSEAATDKQNFTQAHSRIRSFIDGLIASREFESLQEASTKSGENKNMANDRNVFVVHGRNVKARKAMCEFLRSLDLHPIEFSSMIKLTGKGSPYIGEVISTGFKNARAIVVLLTPDDEARVKEKFRLPDDGLDETELTGQPRQNVLFEAGMALGIDEDRTVIVTMGTMRGISDIVGRHVIRMSNSADRRKDLSERLKTAGCVVNDTGNDWLTTGDFDSAMNETTDS